MVPHIIHFVFLLRKTSFASAAFPMEARSDFAWLQRDLGTECVL